MNALCGAELALALIPPTLEAAPLSELRPGLELKLEVDLLARYVERIMTGSMKESRA